MELSEYKQRIGKSRHIEVEIKCEQCGELKWVKWIRVKKGQGRFCSFKCYGVSQKKGQDRLYVGKENAKKTFDTSGQSYYVYWFDRETLQRNTTSYAHWWWEINKGEIPEGYRASYKDGNRLNISDENICIISPEEFGKVISNSLMGHTFSEETLQKMSDARKGMKLSEEHKSNIGKATKKLWDSGVFDTPEIRDAYSKQGKSTKGSKRTDEQRQKMSEERITRYLDVEKKKIHSESILRGKDHPNWRGGSSEEKYPSEFSRSLRESIRSRDRDRCRVCGKYAGNTSGRVHHIDANKNNSSEGNLILVCVSCHSKIHSSVDTEDLVIKAFRGMLDY